VDIYDVRTAAESGISGVALRWMALWTSISWAIIVIAQLLFALRLRSADRRRGKGRRRATY